MTKVKYKVPKMKLKYMIQEWKYWHITRKTRKIVPWIARNLPARIKYFVVIDGMVKVEPNLNPSDVTGMQILDHWSESVKGL